MPPRDRAEPGAARTAAVAVPRCHRATRLSPKDPGHVEWATEGSWWSGRRGTRPSPEHPRRITRACPHAPEGHGSTRTHRVAAPRCHRGTRQNQTCPHPPRCPPAPPGCPVWGHGRGTRSGLGPTREPLSRVAPGWPWEPGARQPDPAAPLTQPDTCCPRRRQKYPAAGGDPSRAPPARRHPREPRGRRVGVPALGTLRVGARGHQEGVAPSGRRG